MNSGKNVRGCNTEKFTLNIETNAQWCAGQVVFLQTYRQALCIATSVNLCAVFSLVKNCIKHVKFLFYYFFCLKH